MSGNPIELVFDLLAFLFALSVHEASHAWTADLCGDDTARMLGRVTLNPLPHIDPIGTIMMPLMGMISGLPILGWAKPTPVNPNRLRHPRRDDILVTVAGPASNFLVATVSLVILALLRFFSVEGRIVIDALTSYRSYPSEGSLIVPVALLLYRFLAINVLLGVFNLIPIPPLDGGQILGQLLPSGWQGAYEELGRYGFLILMGLLFLGVPYMIFDPVFALFNVLLRS